MMVSLSLSNYGYMKYSADIFGKFDLFKVTFDNSNGNIFHKIEKLK